MRRGVSRVGTGMAAVGAGLVTGPGAAVPPL